MKVTFVEIMQTSLGPTVARKLHRSRAGWMQHDEEQQSSILRIILLVLPVLEYQEMEGSAQSFYFVCR